MSTGRAILVGRVVVNLPVLAIMIAAGLLGRTFAGSFGLGLVLGAIPAWLWWSLSVPRWRAWAHARGADPAELQRIGVMTGLVWPKGWMFEKTELPPRDRDKDRGAA